MKPPLKQIGPTYINNVFLPMKLHNLGQFWAKTQVFLPRTTMTADLLKKMT